MEQQQKQKREKLFKKRIIVPEMIWSKEIEINGKPATKWFVKFRNCIFSGFQEPTFKEGERAEITYDDNSKYEKVDERGETTFFYNLVNRVISKKEIIDEVKKIRDEINSLLKKCEATIENKKTTDVKSENVEKDSVPAIDDIPEEDVFDGDDVPEEGIPAVEDEDVL